MKYYFSDRCSENDSAFTLFEILIVLVIVSVMLYISYPLISNFALYPDSSKNFDKTARILKYLMNKRYSRKFHAVFVKFDFRKNLSEIYYEKDMALKPLKKLKIYKILYKNIRLYEIKTKGKVYKHGFVYEEFSKRYISPPFKLYFLIGNHKKIICVKTYYNKLLIK
jgi:prepilin-type N-terminal cleavage/methylation domain-containing protein